MLKACSKKTPQMQIPDLVQWKWKWKWKCGWRNVFILSPCDMSERWDKMSAEYRSSCLQYKAVLLNIVNIVYYWTLSAIQSCIIKNCEHCVFFNIACCIVEPPRQVHCLKVFKKFIHWMGLIWKGLQKTRFVHVWIDWENIFQETPRQR